MEEAPEAMKWTLVRGAGAAFLLSFPAAAVVGLVWRFPVPMAGYTRGIEALVMAPIGAFFYMVFGGFILVPLGGAIVTRLALRRNPPSTDDKPRRRLIWVSGGGTALAFALGLAGLELLIGVW